MPSHTLDLKPFNSTNRWISESFRIPLIFLEGLRPNGYKDSPYDVVLKKDHRLIPAEVKDPCLWITHLQVVISDALNHTSVLLT
jgi:hypothetical protein